MEKGLVMGTNLSVKGDVTSFHSICENCDVYSLRSAMGKDGPIIYCEHRAACALSYLKGIKDICDGVNNYGR